MNLSLVWFAYSSVFACLANSTFLCLLRWLPSCISLDRTIASIISSRMTRARRCKTSLALIPWTHDTIAPGGRLSHTRQLLSERAIYHPLFLFILFLYSRLYLLSFMSRDSRTIFLTFLLCYQAPYESVRSIVLRDTIKNYRNISLISFVIKVY